MFARDSICPQNNGCAVRFNTSAKLLTSFTTVSLLKFDFQQPPPVPKDAATLVLLRDGDSGLEVFCVERHSKSGFMAGAVVFPGGKVDESDSDPAWPTLVMPPREGTRQDLAIAACRESLEEAAILPVTGSLDHDYALVLRQALASGLDVFRSALKARGLLIDLASLVPFARWITPEPEVRRFDAHFFMLRAPEGQEGAHDSYETMSSFWATPTDVLARFEKGEVQLAPPTHRTLEILSEQSDVDAALAMAEGSSLEPIRPVLIDYDGTMALTLPGDPDHPQKERIIPGRTRYVLRGDQWRAE
jgi:8-oxo-dGTP pyrophosphatase MutT (NUDIX family)